ncbi:unnamed protein product, partial [Rotaria magnacalcarata]
PDDSDDDDLSICDEHSHLKYKFFTNETENSPKHKDIGSIKDLSISNGNSEKRLREQAEETDTTSIENNH